MSFKDCVNTKDCEKMQTDIEDVKDSISGISDDVEIINETTIPAIEDDIATINETTIPAIQDDISSLDDRVTTLENASGGGDWILFENNDWSSLVDSDGNLKQDVLINISFYDIYSTDTTSYLTYISFIIPKGIHLYSMYNPYDRNFFSYGYNTTNKPLSFIQLTSHSSQSITGDTIDISFYQIIMKTGSSTWTVNTSVTKTLTKNATTSVSKVFIYTH